MDRTFHFLSHQSREKIAETAFQLLEQVGVTLTHPKARDLLQKAGASLEGDRARIPAELVEQALSSAPVQIDIYTRDGEQAMRLGGGSAHFGAHTDAPDVLDPFSGERRPCTQADVTRNVILIDALDQIDYMTASGMVADCPAEIADRVSLGECLINSPKPVLVMPVTPESLVDCHRMAALAADGEENLRQRPLMIVYSEPVSPLIHPDGSIQRLLYCAENEIPLVYTPYAAMGGTAPLSPAAITAQLCAESLSGLVIHQLQQPGAPYIFGGMASVMDMRTTIFSYGAPEFQRGNTLMAEMAHHFELPNFGTAGTSDAQTFDGQAIMEATSSCLMAYLAGANLIHDVGLLGNATVVMPEMITATNEIIAMLHHLLGEVKTDAEALAFDVLAEAGPGGEFITHPHTFDHFRSVWYPNLLFRQGDEAWKTSEQEDFAQQVNAKTREIIESHQLDILPKETARAIRKILTEAKESL